ncbi:MAG: PorT family protein, partial [Hymenobacter sp.]
MKKIIFSFALLASASTVAQAQIIKYGVKAGGSLTSFTGSNSDSRAYKLGFHGGVLANFGLSDLFSIQPEVLYSMKGS